VWQTQYAQKVMGEKHLFCSQTFFELRKFYAGLGKGENMI